MKVIVPMTVTATVPMTVTVTIILTLTLREAITEDNLFLFRHCLKGEGGALQNSKFVR